VKSRAYILAANALIGLSDLDQPYKNPIITTMLSYIRKETYGLIAPEARDEYGGSGLARRVKER